MAKCKVCEHHDRRVIEFRVKKGDSDEVISEDYGNGFNRKSLERHRHNHMFLEGEIVPTLPTVNYTAQGELEALETLPFEADLARISHRCVEIAWQDLHVVHSRVVHAPDLDAQTIAARASCDMACKTLGAIERLIHVREMVTTGMSQEGAWDAIRDAFEAAKKRKG